MIREELYTGPKGSQKITTTVKAGEVFNTRSVAKSFYIIATTGNLTVTPEGRSASIFGAKSGLVFEGELPENLQINNETGVDIVFTIFYGFGKYLDENPVTTGAVTITSSALPAGASTAAKQDTGNTLLAAIDAATALMVPDIDAIRVATQASATEATLAAMSAKLPAALDADGRLKVANQVVGAQGNAWNAAAVGAAGVSAAIDTKDRANVSAFGSVDAATTITVQVSEDNVTFYDTGSTSVLVGAGDFHISLNTGAKYARLKSSGAATITATIAAK